MGLRDMEAKLPPGFRFCPRDEELVCHYLYKKVAHGLYEGSLVEVDLHTCEPWKLPEAARFGGNEWYFFNFRDRKYSTGFRMNRASTAGYWKATGKDRPVFDPATHALVGMRKTLVFYRDRAPHGVKTGWIMHEFRLENPYTPSKEDWVLCRVFRQNRGASTKFSREDECDNIGCSSPSNLLPPPKREQSTLDLAGYDQALLSALAHQEHTSTGTLLNLAEFSRDLLELPQTEDHAMGIGMTTKNEENFGFLFDMDLEDQTLSDWGATLRGNEGC